MSWLLANTYDAMMAPGERARIAAWRAELLTDIGGQVLEVGAGTGANLSLYPAGVRDLVLTDPDRHMLRRLELKLEANPLRPVRLVQAPVEELPFEEASFDAVVGTLVLCSVRDLGQAVAEIRRVLRPGGRYAFLEHVGAAGATRTARAQRLLEPVWRRLAGNCHLTRQSVLALQAAGFQFEHVVHEHLSGVPLVRDMVRGHAVR